MSTEPASPTTATPAGRNCESKKLVSLLALAAGATALPQTADASIVFTDLSSNPASVGSLSSPSYLIDTLPGTARLGFAAHTRVTAISYSKNVTAAQKAGYVRIKTSLALVIPASAGKTWNQIGGTLSASGIIGAATFSGHIPNSYNNKYLAFRFKDSTLPGTPLRYGWVEISLSNPANGGDPNVAIFGYAYDTTGATIAMGAVPEPSSTALLALGALALGAKGVRRWKRSRAQSQ